MVTSGDKLLDYYKRLHPADLFRLAYTYTSVTGAWICAKPGQIIPSG